ncbi:MAG: 3'-5' exonuclease [Peptococcaceae bacterium]|jgi:DNA helicase-2/ATP-dependent DNA helicase PcrA
MDLTTLNSQQLEAVLTTEGPLLILAGAGSGKTNVLVHRIAYLIEECNVLPYHILAITFTNKAANEMRDRIIDMIGERGSRIWARTFHSACLQILRFEVEHTDLKENFGIYDTSDQLSIVKRILKQRNIDADVLKPSSVLNGISKIKNKFFDLNEGLKRVAEAGSLPEIVIDVIEEYQATLQENNAIDFDDILCLVVKLFKTHPDILEQYQERFQYIMVDEYQDTNKIQYELIHLLAAKYENICVVGDDDQSIYEWRGADVQNILSFEKDHENAKIIKLEENYRSTKKILHLANAVIANNETRKEKALWTQNEEGEPIVYYEADDDRDEGHFIVRQIKDIMNKSNYSYGDFAVLIRTSSQFRSLEEVFLKNGVPYRIYGGIKFFQRKEIKDILAYLSVLANPNDSVNMKRIINIPKRGIGEQTWNKILDFKMEHQPLSLVDVLTAPELKTSAKVKNALKSFSEFIENGRVVASEQEMEPLLNYVIKESGYVNYLYDSDPVAADLTMDNIEEFLSIAKEFDLREMDYEDRNLSGFLEEIALYTDLDQSAEGLDSVSLMTMHSSKGLEFPVVFVAGFEENLFPHIRAKEEKGLEEERRLCYVAFTRAEDMLFITRAEKRMIHGRFMYNQPSEFVDELDERYYTNVSKKRYFKNEVTATRKKPAVAPAAFNVGDKVKHSSWGDGVVVAVDSDDDTKITVAFPSEGLKTISTQYAPIEKA